MANFSCKDYSSIFNAWCHFEGDSYFTQKKFPNFSGTEGVLYGLANPSASDTWRTMISVPLYADNSNISGTSIEQLSCVAAGAFPTFGTEIFKQETPTEVTKVGSFLLHNSTKINSVDGGLLIGVEGEEVKVTTRDGATPKFIIVALQGAGGGGGGTDNFDNGSGGGAGGFVCGVVKVSDGLSIIVGRGGTGGKVGSYYDPDLGQNVSDGITRGNPGTASELFLGGTVYLKANGGTGGDRAESSGGSGGDYTKGDTDVYCVVGCKGGTGGGTKGRGAATGCSELTAYCTANTNKNLGAGSGLPTYKTWAATSGGAHGYSDWTGGGGGSMLSNGPAGAGGTSDGKKGSLGAGGSGACWTFGAYKQGGKGGDGAVYIYY